MAKLLLAVAWCGLGVFLVWDAFNTRSWIEGGVGAVAFATALANITLWRRSRPG
jgi:hypothetical protein